MPSVQVLGLDSSGKSKPIGVISLSGSHLHCEPDILALRNILDSELLLGTQRVTKDEPEKFLQMLPYQYRGAYLRVIPKEG